MPRPGTDITITAVPPPRSQPTDTGVAFVTGTADMGPVNTAMRLTSMADFIRIYGQRQPYSVLYDWLDAFFHEGGAVAYVVRVVGPAAVVATRNLLDGSAGQSLVVSAIGPGASYNSVLVGVVAGGAGGSFQIQVQYPGGTVVEQSGDLLTQADAVNWALSSNYIRIAQGASALNPAVAAAAALAGGNDDRAAITETQWTNQLALFTSDLGPGQVAAAGRTTTAANLALLAHAALNNRVALIDTPDTPTAATLIAAAVAARSNGQYGAMFAPWVQIPGISGTTYRSVPPSAIVAGIIARNDRVYNPNAPAAGDQGQAQYAIGLTQPAWDDPTRANLNNNGVNALRMILGGVRIYGYRMVGDPVAQAAWIDFGNVRLAMYIKALVQNILEQYVFDQIDGRGVTINALGGDIAGALLPLYNAGALYGVTPDQAFFVDVGPQVNTPTTLGNNELHAQVACRMSPMAEWVQVNISKVPITQPLV